MKCMISPLLYSIVNRLCILYRVLDDIAYLGGVQIVM